MDFKEQLEQELLEVIQDLKRIKYMHKNENAINAKRMAYEARLNAILKALEIANKQPVSSNKAKKGGVVIE